MMKANKAGHHLNVPDNLGKGTKVETQRDNGRVKEKNKANK